VAGKVGGNGEIILTVPKFKFIWLDVGILFRLWLTANKSPNLNIN